MSDGSTAVPLPPVAEKNISKINSILSAVNRFYKRIGIWYLLTVSALALLFPLFLQSDLPFSVICPVVLLSGLTQAASFVVCGTCRLLIQAEGQNYVLNNVQTFVSVFTAIGKIVLLLQGYHLAAIQTMYFAVSLSQFAFIRFYMKRQASVAEFFCGAESWGFVTEAFGFDPSDLRSDFPEYGRPDPDICLRIKNSQRLHYVCHAFRHDCHSHFNCQ